MGLYEMFGTDKDAESRGIWVHFGGGVSVHMKRSGGSNAAFKARVERLHRENRRSIELGVMTDDELRPQMIELYATTVLLDWKGVTDRSGKEMAFNKKNVVQVLTDLPEFFDEIRAESAKLENFRVITAEETGKNSQTS